MGMSWGWRSSTDTWAKWLTGWVAGPLPPGEPGEGARPASLCGKRPAGFPRPSWPTDEHTEP